MSSGQDQVREMCEYAEKVMGQAYEKDSVGRALLRIVDFEEGPGFVMLWSSGGLASEDMTAMAVASSGITGYLSAEVERLKAEVERLQGVIDDRGKPASVDISDS